MKLGLAGTIVTLAPSREIQEIDNDTKNHIFATIDAFIKAAKLKNIAAL